MLTKIEIDGFKTFRGFTLDLQPFNVIAGTNASGKSNLFDAIQFLALLAETDLRSAASGLRGEPYELTRARQVQRHYQQTLDPENVGQIVTNAEVNSYLATVGVG